MPQENNVTTSPLMKNNWKYFLIGISIIAGVLILGSGYLLAYNIINKSSSTPTSTANPTSTTSVTSTVTMTPTIDPYAGWQTYANTSANLWFKYPPSWTLATDSNSNQGTNCSAVTLTITSPEGYKIQFTYNLDGCDYGGSEPGNFVNYKQVKIAGTSYYKAYMDECNSDPSIQGCKNNVIEERLISSIPNLGFSGEYSAGGYIKLNGHTSSLNLNLATASTSTITYGDPSLTSIDKNFDMFLSSISFTTP